MNYETKNYRKGIEVGFIRRLTFKLPSSVVAAAAIVNLLIARLMTGISFITPVGVRPATPKAGSGLPDRDLSCGRVAVGSLPAP